MVLDDDEAQMASALVSLPTSTAHQEDDDISETEEHQNMDHSSGDEEDNEQQDIDISQDANNSSIADMGPLTDNGVHVKLLFLLSF